MATRIGNNMDALLVEWKHRLGLDDWHIVLEQECSPNDMTLSGVQGECERDEVNKCGVIRVLCEKDYGNRILPFDKEKVLVHELMHFKFVFLEMNENELQNRLVHQYIDDLARALVDAKRSGVNGKIDDAK